MIIQIGTDVDESRILWKHKESDEWKRADIDDLIEAYENRQKEPKPGDSISRQALIDEILEEGNGAVLSYPTGMYEDDLVERIEKQMIDYFVGVIKYASPVEPKQSELHIDEPRGYTLKKDKAEVYSERPKGKWTNYGADVKDKDVSNKEIGLESILDEIKEILTFYSFDVPMVYGDGEETVEKAVLLEEVEYAIQSISDMRGGTENE